MFLYYFGKCVVFEDEKRGLMFAECTLDGDLNNYYEPVSLTPTGIDVDCKRRIIGEDCVLVRNNDIMLPTDHSIELFAFRLADTTRTIDLNVRAQKTPILILGTEKQRLTMKNVYNQYEGNAPVIYGEANGLDPETIRVLKTDAPVVFPELQTHKECLWNEALTFLGINNANTDKRERLITDEVEANNEHIELSAHCMLKSRQKAVEQINKMFNTNIKVSLRSKEEIEKCTQDTLNTSET